MSNIAVLPLGRGGRMRLDAHGCIRRADPAWARALAVSAEALHDRPLAEVLSRQDQGRLRRGLARVQLRGVQRTVLDLALPGAPAARVTLTRDAATGDLVLNLDDAELDTPLVTPGGADTFRMAFEHSFEPTLVLGADGAVVQANPAAASFLGVSREALVGLPVDDIIDAPSGDGTARAALSRALADGRRCIEAPSRCGFTAASLIEWRLAPLPENGPGVCLISPRDIAAERQRQAQDDYLAHYDALTGLCNRRRFQEQLEQRLEGWRAAGSRAPTVALLNLDSFREVNAAFGNRVGDQVLRTMAQRLVDAVRDTDTVARFSGDVFALLLEGVDAAGRDELARRLLDCVAEPMELLGQEVCVTACLGMALAADEVSGVDPVYGAELALNEARRRGRDAYRLYTRSMSPGSGTGLRVAADLRRALQRQEFRLLYQPQVVAGSGHVVGLEALLRWDHPERGLIPPAEFIPVLEESSLIVPVGEWVLRRACEDQKLLQQAGLAGLHIAVNLSPRQLETPSFVQHVEAVLAETGVRPEDMELEVTESLFMSPRGDSEQVLQRLAGLGLRLAVDDFGTGYSALAYLKRFPVCCLKIDKSFIRGVGVCREDTAIVNAVGAMARQLDLDVVAEGVETQAQVEFLAAQPGVVAQGFHYARPSPLSELMQRMNAAREAIRLAC